MCARARGNDNIPVCFFENADRVFHNRTRLRAQARIEGGLSATGLVARELHGEAEAAENADDSLTSLRVERIDETGDEELYGRHESIVILKGVKK